MVGIAFNCGRQKQTLNIIPLVKIHHEFADFFGSGFGARYVVAAAVYAVLTIVSAIISHQYFQQRNASAVRRKRMAYSALFGVSQSAFRIFP